MTMLSEDDELIGELAAIRPEQTDAFACSLRAAVRRSLTGAAVEPFRLGRFTVLEPLGGGGMGVVFLAYDPDLDRKIALKVLRSGGARGRSDVLREGRALARLKHANIVAVYDVGVLDDDVFVAMEYVEGKNLREWLRERRSTEAILARLIEVGRGLAAVHAVDVVHRDCKPENLVIDAQGHARVIDFGLARPLADPPKPCSSAADATTATVSVHGGTPAYMAPECLGGAAGSQASDQFSFCVTCWEALFGARPSEQRSEPTSGRSVPRWLRRVLERGLSPEPAKRWPSMTALLSALEGGKRRTRIGRAAVAVLAVAGGVGARSYLEAQQVAACEAEGASIAEVWNGSVQAKLQAGLLATGVVYAESSAARVVPYFAAYAEAWSEARTESCLDARVRGHWSEETLDRGSWCLDERRLELAELIAALTQADAAVIQDAVVAAAGLSQVGPCRDARRLATLPPLPHDRDGVTSVLRTLSRAGALRAAGAYEQGLGKAREALAAAEELGWPPLTAAAHWRIGDLLERSGVYPEAEAAFERAYFQAAGSGALEVAADAAVKLVWTVGNRLARGDDGFRWSEHAEVVFSTLGVDEHSLQRAHALNNVALLHENKGAYGAAQTHHERALAIKEKVLGPDHPQLAISLNNLANVHRFRGTYAEARAYHARALAIREKALGPDHPDVAQSLNNLASVHDSTGAYTEAKALLERALAIREKALGPDHPDLATTLNNLANVQDSLGAREEARALHERALAIRERVLGPDHPHVAHSLNNLGQLHESSGAYDAARPLYERALAIKEKALGPDHPHVADSLDNLGTLQLSTGAYAEAKALYERALAIREKAPGATDPEVAYSLTGLAKVALAQRRPADAVALAERALRVREAGETPPEWLARSRFVLARALQDASGQPGPEHDRALALARQAHDALRGSKGRAHELAEIEAFLTNNAGAP